MIALNPWTASYWQRWMILKRSRTDCLLLEYWSRRLTAFRPIRIDRRFAKGTSPLKRIFRGKLRGWPFIIHGVSLVLADYCRSQEVETLHVGDEISTTLHEYGIIFSFFSVLTDPSFVWCWLLLCWKGFIAQSGWWSFRTACLLSRWSLWSKNYCIAMLWLASKRSHIDCLLSPFLSDLTFSVFDEVTKGII